MPKTFRKIPKGSRAGIIESLIGMALLGLLVGNLAGCGDKVGNAGASFIAISGSNKIVDNPPNKYQLPFTLLVTSKKGDPIEGAVVELKVEGQRFRKGSYPTYDSTAGLWSVNIVDTCPNEDTDGDAVLEYGEDTDGDDSLEPGNPVSYSPASEDVDTTRIVTNSNGFADFTLNYGKQYATWTEAKITAKTSVTGTESEDTATVWLGVLKGDVDDQDVAPPNAQSPFGTVAGCNNPG